VTACALNASANPFETTEATPPEIAAILVQVLMFVVESVPSWPWLLSPLTLRSPSFVAKEADADDAISQTQTSETNPATPSTVAFVHEARSSVSPRPNWP
jgi:hypothetical protein